MPWQARRYRADVRWARAATAAAMIAGSLTFGAVGAPLAAAEDDEQVTVLSRNIYLGADVGTALDALPDLPKAAGLLWEEMRLTDWPTRVNWLAEEIVESAPDVVGLQEAARWVCKPSLLRGEVDVHNFTEDLLAAISAAGAEYVVAQAGSDRAENEAFQIGPLPFVDVTDPEVFQPLFGKDSVACGFVLSDVLLVRAELAENVQRAGTSEFEDRVSLVPTVMAIDRGYAWADIAIGSSVVRFVTAHLESLWYENEVPLAATHARQLVADLEATTGPLVVVGDFNSDPRDPRGPDDPNPAGQPEYSPRCPPQSEQLTVQDSRDECSAYWTMRKAGYVSAGPDDFDPKNATYGTSALLAGPDPDRLRTALAAGNNFGFTDRLDYVFTRNDVRTVRSQVTSFRWPSGPTVWPCETPEQIADTAAAGEVLADAGRPTPPAGAGRCLPSDHAGLLVTLAVPAGASVADDPEPISHNPFRLVWWHLVLGLVLVVAGLIWWRRRRRSRRREHTDGDG